MIAWFRSLRRPLKRTGALGLEHSLPPYYYVTGISHPAIRGPFYARALAPA